EPELLGERSKTQARQGVGAARELGFRTGRIRRHTAVLPRAHTGLHAGRWSPLRLAGNERGGTRAFRQSRRVAAMSLFGVACTGAGSEREEPQAAAPKAAAQPDAARPRAAEHAGEDAGGGGPRAAAPEAGPANVPSDPNGNDEDDGAPRVYAKTRFVWIWPNPSSEGQWIGFLWTGGSVRLRDPEPRFGPGCRHWYAVEPRGYVCVDGDRATLDRDDPGYRLARRFAAKLDSPWPHRYGESLGLRRYATPPTPEQQRLREPDLRAHLERVERARSGEVVEALLGVDLARATGTPIEIA